MPPKIPRDTSRSPKSGRISASRMCTRLEIKYPEAANLDLKDGDIIVRLPSNISLRRQNDDGSITSQIKHFIDPRNSPRLFYEPDATSVFIPESPSQRYLDSVTWSPPDQYRLQDGESVIYRNTNGKLCELCSTDANGFVEIAPQSIAIQRRDPRTASNTNSFLHVYRLIDGAEVALHGPAYTYSVNLGEPHTWVDGRIERLEEPIDLDNYTDTDTITSITEAPLDSTTTARTRRQSTLAATRETVVSSRATTRASGRYDPEHYYIVTG